MKSDFNSRLNEKLKQRKDSMCVSLRCFIVSCCSSILHDDSSVQRQEMLNFAKTLDYIYIYTGIARKKENLMVLRKETSNANWKLRILRNVLL